MNYKKIVDILMDEMTDNMIMFSRDEVNLPLLANNLINLYCSRYGGGSFVNLMLNYDFTTDDLIELGFKEEDINMIAQKRVG